MCMDMASTSNVALSNDVITTLNQGLISNEILMSYIVPALIAAVVGLLSSGLAAFVAYKTTERMIKAENERFKTTLENSEKENAKQRSAEYISNERIRWIQELRNTFATFRAHTTEVAFGSRANGGMIPDYSFEINREATYLKLLLKGYGQKEMDIWKHVDSVITSLAQINSSDQSMDLYFKNMDILTKEIQIYLKIQWERVKVEVNGGMWDKEIEMKYNKRIEDLYKSEID